MTVKALGKVCGQEHTKDMLPDANFQLTHDLAQQMKDNYLSRHPDSEPRVFSNNSISNCNIYTMERLIRQSKRRNLRVTKVEVLEEEGRGEPVYMDGGRLQTNGGAWLNKYMTHTNIFGVYAVTLYDKKKDKSSEMIVMTVHNISRNGIGGSAINYACCDFETQETFLKIMHHQTQKKLKPPTGLYCPQLNNNGAIIYGVPIKVSNPPVIHQSSEEIYELVDNYFTNRKRYLRDKKSGARRILIYGNAGTGKTTMTYQIAHKYANTHSIIFATDVAVIAAHTVLCAKYGMPTIVVAEECDKWMGVDPKDPERDRADGNVKAFLDGHLSPKNKAGELSLLITNYPEKIERTILLRPGRIHESVYVGPLDSDCAFAAAKYYFTDEKGELLCPEDELECFRHMVLTGAQIERLADATMEYVNGSDMAVTQELILEVIKKCQEALEKVKSYKDEETDLEGKVHDGFGFSIDAKKVAKETKETKEKEAATAGVAK